MTVVSCERGDSLSDLVQESGRPIEFSVESDWPEITKSLISNSDDIKGVGFKVWGVKSSDSDGSNSESVFGEDGTSVSFTAGKWKSDVVKDWEGRHYSFASVLHPAKFAGTYSNNTLSIDLGDNGYNLAVNQDDFMVAFQNVDNSDFDASVVELDFRHLFSTIDIRLNNSQPFDSQGIAVTKVMLYGIHKSITGDLQIKQETIYDSTNNKISEDLTTNLADCFDPSHISTDIMPYYERQYAYGSANEFNYSSPTITVVDDLLVFPESLSEKITLSIVIELQQQSKRGKIVANISSGEWLSSKSYTYILPMNMSIFN